jgi:hypothetical protein
MKILFDQSTLGGGCYVSCDDVFDLEEALKSYSFKKKRAGYAALWWRLLLSFLEEHEERPLRKAGLSLSGKTLMETASQIPSLKETLTR